MILFMDGFDSHAASGQGRSDFLRKWDTASISDTACWITNGGVNGGGSLYMVQNGQDRITGTKTIPLSATGADDPLFVGVSVKTGNIYGGDKQGVILCANGPMVNSFDTASGNGIKLLLNNTWFLELWINGTQVATSSAALTTGAWNRVEMKAVVDDAGSIIVHVNGTEVINFAGDTYGSGPKGINTVGIGHCYNTGPDGNLDDFMAWNAAGDGPADFLGMVVIQTIRPSAAGSHGDGSSVGASENYAAVNEGPGPNFSNYVELAAINDRDTYAYGDISSDGSTVLGLQVVSVGRSTGTTIHGVKHQVLSGSDVAEGAEKSLQITGAGQGIAVTTVFPKDPHTNAAWAATAVNAAEFGIKASS